MKIAAVVILYNTEEDVIKNIKSYSSVEKIYAIDNSEKSSESLRESIIAIRNCVYISDKENKGIAARLNQASLLAIAEGYDWLLTMDQDSAFEDENFNNYISCCRNYPGNENVALFGVAHETNQLQAAECNAVAVKQLITSGSLLNLKNYQQIGDFDEALYIDQVDFDYCYRSVLNDFLVIRFDNIFLKHSIGKTSVHQSLKSFKQTKRSLHSPTRMYYMVRNYFYMQSRYKKQFKAELASSRKDLLVRIKNNFLYSNKRLSVLKHIALGFRDYQRKRMGKL